MLALAPEPDLDEEEEQTEFRFEELSERAKQNARESYSESLHDWWGFVYAEAEQVGELMGITFGQTVHRTVGGKTFTEPDISFTGFWSQGDGASFCGTWDPPKEGDIVAAVKLHAPGDDRLHAIAAALAGLATRAAKFDVSVAIERGTSRYSHEHTVSIYVDQVAVPEDFLDWDRARQANWEAIRDATVGDAWEKEAAEALRSFMRWIYAQLEKEYEHLTSDEQVAEALADFRFDEDGEII